MQQNRTLSGGLAGLLAAALLAASPALRADEPVPVAPAQAVQNCNAAAPAQAAAKTRGVGRLAAAGGRFVGRLGGGELVQSAADVAAATGAAAAVAELAGEVTDCTPAEQAGASAAAPPAQAQPQATSSRPARQRNCGALGAGCADGMQPLVTCMAEKSFWGEMADAVERKRGGASGLSGEQQQEMDADIAAMRAAHAAQAGRVQPVDPAKPNRHTDWLTPEEYSQAATQTSATLNAHRQVCNDRYAGF